MVIGFVRKRGSALAIFIRRLNCRKSMVAEMQLLWLGFGCERFALQTQRFPVRTFR